MDVAIDELVQRECEVDRTYGRLDQKWEALHDSIQISADMAKADLPVEYRMADEERVRRCQRLMAQLLRRFGEHRLANLLVTDPATHDRIRDDDVHFD